MPPDVKTTEHGQVRDATTAIEPAAVHGNERHEPSSVFPIGSLYANTTGDDPSILLGYGTWYLVTTL